MAGEVRDVRHNVITISSITAFADVKGGIHDFCKDVYFMQQPGGGDWAAGGRACREAKGECSSLSAASGTAQDAFAR